MAWNGYSRDAALAHPFDDGPPALLYQSVEATAATLGADGGELSPPDGPAGSRLGRDGKGAAGAAATGALSVWAGTVRPESHAIVACADRDGFSGRPGARLLFRHGRPFDAAAGTVAERRLRHGAGASPAMRSAGRSRAADRRRSPTHWSRISQSLGGEVVTGQEVKSLDESAAVARRSGRHHAAAARSNRREHAADRLSRRGSDATATAWAHSSWTGRWTGRSPGSRPKWRGRGRCIWGDTGGNQPIRAGRRARGEIAEQPYVLLAQQSLFDPTRAPDGKHTVWGYCHVPNGCTVDMTERIEAQIERFAPGFRDRILATSRLSPRGDGALQCQLHRRGHQRRRSGLGAAFHPSPRPLDAWSTPVPGLYLCSSSTPPGGGVHGMCGYYAAMARAHPVLRRCPPA